MVRFYRTYLGRALIGLILLIEIEKQGGKDGVAALVNNYQPAGDDNRHNLANALDLYTNSGIYGDESPTTEDVLKGAFGQLSKRKNDESDLLDVIVNMLRLPTNSYISGSILRTLRDAILTPSELGELRQTLKNTARCACGHEFKSGEMISPVVDGDALVLQCTNCARPQYVRCDSCDTLVPFSSRIGASIRSVIDCGCQKKAKDTPDLSGHLTPSRAAAQMRVMKKMTVRSAPTTPQPSSFIYSSNPFDGSGF